MRLGYYITESSEHFSEYDPWFIKRDRPDLIEQYHVPLDEYPRRCIEQNKSWAQMAADLEAGKGFDRPQRSVGIRLAHHSRHGNGRADVRARQREQQRVDRQPARRLLRGSALSYR